MTKSTKELQIEYLHKLEHKHAVSIFNIAHAENNNRREYWGRKAESLMTEIEALESLVL